MTEVLSLQQVLVDASGHLLGRLASILAKAILQVNTGRGSIWNCDEILFVLLGQRVIVVRCEELNISGSFHRNKLVISGTR